MTKPTMLYVYDVEDWSIHNVGKLWFSSLQSIDTTFVREQQLTTDNLDDFDVVWFGYLHLFLDTITRIPLKRRDLTRWVVAIHDPGELFPVREDWRSLMHKSLSPHRRLEFRHVLRLLFRVGHVVTTSTELQVILSSYGLRPHLLPTCSTLPARPSSSITTTKCDVLSVFAPVERKNLPLLRDTMAFCQKTLHLRADTKEGRISLPEEEYVQLLDRHEVYLCTSYQEGGPLPAMDAMLRGAVVVTTPVGQIQDIVQDGVNGFLCTDNDDFRRAMTILSKDLSFLHAMRLRSLETAKQRGDTHALSARVNTLLAHVLADEAYPVPTLPRHATRLQVVQLRVLRTLIMGLKRLMPHPDVPPSSTPTVLSPLLKVPPARGS